MEFSAVAKINDRLRKSMSLGQLNISLSDLVSGSVNRPEIIKAIRNFKDFDPDLDINGDHSIGIVVVTGNAYVFRFTYDDDRYDYSSEIGKRTLAIYHLSEFRSIKLGMRVQFKAKRIMEQGIG